MRQIIQIALAMATALPAIPFSSSAQTANPESATDSLYHFKNNGNPLITHKHTADPATMVIGDTLWLFTGYDEPGNKEGYHMPNWCAFSTTDMINWVEHPIPVRADDFKWNDAHVSFAGHPVKGPDGKYYFYSSTNWCGRRLISPTVSISVTLLPSGSSIAREVVSSVANSLSSASTPA